MPYQRVHVSCDQVRTQPLPPFQTTLPASPRLNNLVINIYKKGNVGLPWRSSGWHSTLPMQGARVRSLVGELGSRTPHSVAKKFLKKKKGAESKQNPDLLKSKARPLSPERTTCQG